MIKHLLKITWNRKRMNYLIMLEIFFSYLVLFSVVILVIYFLNIYNKPLGFEYKNIWQLSMGIRGTSSDEITDKNKNLIFNKILNTLNEFPELESYSYLTNPPFSGDQYGGELKNKQTGAYERIDANYVGDNLPEVLGVKVIHGRWFSKEDDASTYKPVVINRKAAEIAFGNDNPLGKEFVDDEEANKPHPRVIGIIDDFRIEGNFGDLKGSVFHRVVTSDKNQTIEDDFIPNNFLIKMRPGTTTRFEEKLIARLQPEAKEWSFTITPLEKTREGLLKATMIPLYMFAIVAGFLLIMVALGLTGVLWQNVTKRTKEMGLRRACGAARKKIHKQILGELFVITTIALIAGVLVVVQFPLLNILGFANWKVYTISVIVSALIIYLITTICGLYPSRMATKIHPAEALHYE